MMMNRRLCLAYAAALLLCAGSPALAKDGDENEGGSDNSGSGNSGGDGSDDSDKGDDDKDKDGDSGKGGDDRSGKDGRDGGDDRSGKGGWSEAGLDRAQAAVRAGRIQPLAEILPVVRNKTPGRVLDVTLLRNGSAYRYEVLVLGPSGIYQEVTINASTREILSVRKR